MQLACLAEIIDAQDGQSTGRELLDCCDGLKDEDAYKKARTVVNLVSDVNSELFLQITEGGERMCKELKKMLLPEQVEAEKRLADKDAEIADKDAQIAVLERKLAAAGL